MPIFQPKSHQIPADKALPPEVGADATEIKPKLDIKDDGQVGDDKHIDGTGTETDTTQMGISDTTIVQRPSPSPHPIKQPWHKKLKFAKCNCENCNTTFKKVCPYYPGCCDFPLKNLMQFLVIADIVLAFFTCCFWIYFHQFDPFIERTKRSNGSEFVTVQRGSGSTTVSTILDNYDYHESTTVLGPPLFDSDVDTAAESIRYSKIAFLQSKFQQEVEEGCGMQYFADYLFGHQLNVTRELFYEMVHLNYLAEGIYIFIAVSFITTTCCYSQYSSAKVYLIFIWHLELVPVYCRIWILIISHTQRFCILEHGIENDFHTLSFVFWINILPMITFRFYKLIVFTHFIKTIFTSGGSIKIQVKREGVTLKEYVKLQEEYLRADKNRDKSSSEDEENETIL